MVGTFAAACAVVATVGVSAWIGLRHRGSTDLDDYTVARDSQAAGALGLSFLASGLGAWLLFAVPEIGAGVGVAGVVGYALATAAPFAVLAWLGPRLRSVLPRGHGLTEFVRLRFGAGFHRYVVAVSLLYMLVFVAAELTAVGAVTGLLSSLDPRVSVVAVALATAAYTSLGGLRASLRTDRWQALAVVVLLVVAAVAGAVALPISAGEAISVSGLLGVDRVGVEAALTLVLAVTAANLFHHGYWQRVWAAHDVPALRRGALLGAVGSVPLVLLVGLTGLAAVGAGLDLGSPPAPFFAVLTGLPSWLLVAVLVLGVALVASTVDTLLSGIAALMVVERPAAASTSLRAARGITVLVLLPAVVVGLQGLSVLRLLLVADLLAATAVVPALLGLWSRATPRAAWVGALAGVVGALAPGMVTAGSFVDGLQAATFPTAVPTLAPFAGAIAASALVTVALSVAAGRRTDLTTLADRVPALAGGDGDRLT